MNKENKVWIVRMIIAMLLTVAAVFFQNNILRTTVFLTAYFISGYKVLWKAIRNILHGQIFDENFLMSLATIGAIALGEYTESIAVMIFYEIGEFFQEMAVDKSRKSIAELMDIRPDYANVFRENQIWKVSPEELEIGDIIIVKVGERMPVDGIIVEGNTFANTSALTGESVPRELLCGAEILSGFINLDSVIRVRVEKKYAQSAVCRVLALAESAASKKSKSENFITKFAKYYTPVVVTLAIALCFIPSFMFGFDTFSVWLKRALIFLVVSCPCALVISVPLSFFGGIGAASKQGILIKGGAYLEKLSKIKTAVFDKTGTLTKGAFEVVMVKVQGEYDLPKLAAFAEFYSSHPIAQSIKNYYDGEIDEKRIIESSEIAGYGVVCQMDNMKIYAGNEKMMQKFDIAFEKIDSAATIVYFAVDDNYAGYMEVSDVVKDNARMTIEALNKADIKTVMLTGDNEAASKKIASELEIQEVYFELLPTDKVRIFEKIKETEGMALFVGDGINDAPVLSLSDVGVAMGNLGSDAAIEAADVVIMNDNPAKLLTALSLSKKTMKIVSQNIIFALSVKFLVLVLGALGMANMWIAVFADVGVSLIAVGNAMRLLKSQKNRI